MNDDDYTPSDVRVRQVWQEFAEMKGSKRCPDEVFAQFNRWLAAHDAALLEAQSAAEPDRRWLEAVAGYRLTVVAERDAALATIDEALDRIDDYLNSSDIDADDVLELVECILFRVAADIT